MVNERLNVYKNYHILVYDAIATASAMYFQCIATQNNQSRNVLLDVIE